VTLKRSLRTVGLTAVAASVLGGWFAPPMAKAQPACGQLGGTVDPSQVCHVRSTTSTYTINVEFPVDYPDQQPVADYLTQLRNDFVKFSQLPAARDWPEPYQLVGEGKTYRSASTQSLVLRMGQDAEPHPVAWFKAFNYDLNKRVPITFDTLFKPGSNPLDIVYPSVLRTVQARSGSAAPTVNGGLDVSNYQNFAITDDAVIFYFSQGQVLSHADGEFEVPVPRADLASVLA
jgi:uncharacterized protein DUF3298